LVRRLGSKRELLLLGYDDDVLHELRVALRRLRSLLKILDSSTAKNLHHKLGRIAATTNAARDWDTLAGRAHSSLLAREFQQVQPWLVQCQAVSHLQVFDMLCSEEWSDVLAELKKFVGKNSEELAEDAKDTPNLMRAMRYADRARDNALKRNDNKRWHKFRVAIKELRYSLDGMSKSEQDESVQQTLQECERLQEYLGNWHDTVVHLRLVRAFSDNLAPQSESDLIAVLGDWCLEMEREGRECLAKVRSRLEDKSSTLFG
jgi:CHAD domain-containing protein